MPIITAYNTAGMIRAHNLRDSSCHTPQGKDEEEDGEEEEEEPRRRRRSLGGGESEEENLY